MALLIAIEGIDGAGKGTHARQLVERLILSGVRVTSLQFPRYSETTFGAAIGDFLNGRFGSLDQVHPQLASVLYAGDRFESRPVLQAAIDNHDIVILDRFTGSNLAHQSAKLDGAERTELIRWIDHVEHVVFGLPRPDLVILIDISSDWSRKLVSRKAARDYTDNEADLHESDLSYLERVRRCYLQLADQREEWRVVESLDTAGNLRTISDINNEMLDIITEHISVSDTPVGGR
ncbi:MAG: thymidylate kinase [Planctomycetaceae bacterium]|nr:thymidylate kinase [Planctomycetaceae bacterium]